MDKLTAIKIKYDDNTYSEEIPIGISIENVDYDNTHNLLQVIGDVDLSAGSIQSQIDELLVDIASVRHAVGSPLVAATASAMTNIDKIYVYTGSETGYVNGNWYYYDGTDWVSGGIYNSVAVETDVNLVTPGMAADAAAVGAAIPQVDDDLDTAGAAADAKATGDALTEINERLGDTPEIKESTATDPDLDVSDPQGNVILRLQDGYPYTKNFNGEEVIEAIDDLETNTGRMSIKESTASGSDLDMADRFGNVIARFENGDFRTARFSSAKHNPHIITLKSDGTGDFSTLRAAVDSITDANYETNPYEIHVYPGVYNTLDGYTDEEIRAADIGGGYTDDSMVGVKLTDGISLIGVGDPTAIIMTAELDTTDYSQAVRGNISTLNLKGSCRIENITVKAKNLRYCVHDDFNFAERYTRIVKNCIFTPIGMVMSSNPATSYGAGIRQAGCDAHFENCDFGFAFGMHTKTGMTGGSVIVFNHCAGLGLRLGDTAAEADTMHHLYIINDCNFASVKITRNEATTPHIEVVGIGNGNTMTFCPSADHPHFVNTLKTRPSSVPVGTLVNVNAGSMTATSGGIQAEEASDIYSALGVIVDKDDNYDYIQTEGYVQGTRLGLSGLSVGDFVTVDSDMKLISGGTASNAVGIVKYTDNDDNSQIWLIRR